MKSARRFALVLFLFVPLLYGGTVPNCDTTCRGGTQPTATGGAALQTWTAVNNQRGLGSMTTASLRVGRSTTIQGSQSFTYAVPLFEIPGAGLGLHLSLYYNSFVWWFNSENNSYAYAPEFDMSPGFTLGYGSVDFSTDLAVGMLTEPTGAKHILVPTATANQYHTTDSTYVQVQYPATAGGAVVATFKDGLKIYYQPFTVLVNGRTQYRPYQVEDTNGNFVSISYADPNDLNISTITDTVGRVIQFTYDSTGKMLQSVAQLDSGGHVFRAYTFTWAQNQILTFAFNRRASAGLGLAPGFYTSGVSQVNLLTGVTRPDNKRVIFDYVHDLNGVNVDNPDWGIVKSIQEQSSNGTPRLTTSYLFPAASAGTLLSNPTFSRQLVNDTVNTKVWTYVSTVSAIGLVTSMVTTDPCGNTQSTTFSSAGDALDGLPIKEVIASAPVPPPGVLTMAGCPRPNGKTWRTLNKTWTTDADGSNPRTQTVSSVLEDGTSQSQVTFNSYDSFGQVTDLLEYGFGANGPGPLLREVVTTYASLANGVANRPSRTTIKDKNGAIVSRRDFNYDEVPVADISPNPTGHDSAFTSSITARGNLTSTTSYAQAAAGGGGVTSTFTYDARGNGTASQSGCCTFSQKHFSGTTDYAFPDSVGTGPSGNSLSLTSSYTYNLLTGTVATSTDPNGQKTIYTYDVDDRLIATTSPDGSTASASFDDASASPSVTTSDNFDSLVQVTTAAGPTVTEQTKNGPSLVSTKTTTADLLGHTISVSNPFGTGDTALYTTYTYDPFGRITQITPPGNSGSYQTSYGIESTSIDGTPHMVQTVTSTDPAGKQRKRYADSLGLRQVDEPGTSGGAAGTGSATINGSEQSVSVPSGGGATAGTGSATTSGLERSTSVLTHAATTATGTVTINGAEQSVLNCPPPPCQPPMPCCAVKPWWKLRESLAAAAAAPVRCITVNDSGTVTITVGGFTVTAAYGAGSTSSTIASALASSLNATNSPVRASVSSNIITITSKGTGSNQNFAIARSSATSDPADFGGPSFTASSAAALSGGTDNVFTTMYDTGNVTVNVTINGIVYSKTSAYGQSSSAASIASDLANKINGDTTLGKLLVAGSSGGVLNLTTTALGTGTADPFSASSVTTSPYFPAGSTSFPIATSGSMLTPGQNGVVFDAGTVTVTITGFTPQPFSKTVNYSQGSTQASVASSLAGAFNADQMSPVIASASLGTVNLTADTLGANTNYGVQVTSATTQGQYFSQPSFSGTAVSLSGGQDPSASLATPISTTYNYDSLDRLLQVNQGVQQRVYAYDDLGQLTSSRIPETTGLPTGFTYTDFGAVFQRTDPRGIVTTYTYDQLGRISQITHSDGTPSVSYTYGGQGAPNFGVGRVTKVVDGSGTTTFQYDLMGRGTQVSRAIGAQTYTSLYAYVNEHLDTVTYPSSRTVKTARDGIGRLSQISSNGSSLLTIGSYNAAGEVLGTTYGNGMVSSYTYNSQLQPATLVSGSSTTPVLNLTYNYGSQNNGQIQGITDGITPSQSTSYTYDELGRLKTAGTNDLTSPNTWKLQFEYDRYGNRLGEIPKGGTANMPFSEIAVDPTSNRIVGLPYDLAGNQTGDTVHSYTYNAENEITKVDGSSSYVYDAGGRRVIKNGTVYIYEGNQVIAEYPNGAAPGSPSVEYVGRLASFAAGATTYYYSDRLSTRALANSAGAVVGRQTQFPFGEMLTALQTGTTTKWQFTTYEGDRGAGESGLDYAQARFYASHFGRFTSLDPLSGTRKDPQSLNRYVYALNDPINMWDPTGMYGGVPGITKRCELLDNGDFGKCVGDDSCEVDGQSVINCGNITEGGFASECPSCGILFFQVGNVAGIVQILNGISFEETWDLSGTSGVLGEQSTSNNVYSSASSGYSVVAYNQTLADTHPVLVDYYGQAVPGAVGGSVQAGGTMSLDEATDMLNQLTNDFWTHSSWLPDGDRKVRMDIWHCPQGGGGDRCAAIWKLASDTVTQPLDKAWDVFTDAELIAFGEAYYECRGAGGDKGDCVGLGAAAAVRFAPVAATAAVAALYYNLWRNVFFGVPK